jgi:predicted acyltransferase
MLIYLIEFRQQQGAWSRFFDAFGKNPLFIFVLSGFLPRVVALFRWVDHTDEQGQPVYISAFAWFYKYVCAPVSADPRTGSLLYALVTIAFYWALAYWLDRKKIYIKV